MSERQPGEILFCWLTQEEFRVCLALVMVGRSSGLNFPEFLDRYPTPGYNLPWMTWEEDFRRAIRFLALEERCVFAGIVAGENGSIQTRGTEPIEPRNIAYYRLLRVGGMPDLLLALQEAQRWCEQGYIRSLDREIFVEAEARIRQDLEQVRDEFGIDNLVKLNERTRMVKEALGLDLEPIRMEAL